MVSILPQQSGEFEGRHIFNEEKKEEIQVQVRDHNNMAATTPSKPTAKPASPARWAAPAMAEVVLVATGSAEVERTEAGEEVATTVVLA